jgi:hypothetical protein
LISVTFIFSCARNIADLRSLNHKMLPAIEACPITTNFFPRCSCAITSIRLADNVINIGRVMEDRSRAARNQRLAPVTEADFGTVSH